ncbi:MAG: hypothetical protein HY053_02270 [Proteobacteria bacterium]|nr:hypothetical protein [Pseudomonadota bacterium]
MAITAQSLLDHYKLARVETAPNPADFKEQRMQGAVSFLQSLAQELRLVLPHKYKVIERPNSGAYKKTKQDGIICMSNHYVEVKNTAGTTIVLAMAWRDFAEILLVAPKTSKPPSIERTIVLYGGRLKPTSVDEAGFQLRLMRILLEKKVALKTCSPVGP